MDASKYIDEIKLVLDEFFVPDRVGFTNKDGVSYILDGSSTALNRFDNREIVKVHPLFDDFWIYVCLTFLRERIGKKTASLRPFISVSFFYGEENDPEKVQLFRAEWDSYNNENSHPQPHWHITTNQSIERVIHDFTDSSTEDGDIFLELLREEERVALNIDKMHFAMAGQWATDGNMVQNIDDPKTLALWLKNLINHVCTELRYIS